MNDEQVNRAGPRLSAVAKLFEQIARTGNCRNSKEYKKVMLNSTVATAPAPPAFWRNVTDFIAV